QSAQSRRYAINAKRANQPSSSRYSASHGASFAARGANAAPDGAAPEQLAAAHRDALLLALAVPLAAHPPCVALLAAPQDLLGASLRAARLERAEKRIGLIEYARVARGAARESVGADEVDAPIAGVHDLDLLLVVVKQIHELIAAAGAANLLGRRIGLLLVDLGPTPINIAGRRVRRIEDAALGVLPVAFDRVSCVRGGQAAA